MKKLAYLLIVCSNMTSLTAIGEAQMELMLEDMSSFQSQAGNWRVVNDVSMDPSVDVHVEDAKVKAVTEKAVKYTPGKGVLLNYSDDKNKGHLVTVWEHGDIDLELEVMLPKGSNSGIYLQGRYEVQLFDSWGVKQPKYSDIGGIYKNWIEPGKPGHYRGKAPLTNAAKAPGEWQKIHIVFRAPKFDSSGKKITNARFVKVELNGVVIHQNVEATNHTGGPIKYNEVATGPLMIQGDHGPVALRNIKYKL
jgi:3-keto-disaccharide hydrolase